MAGSTVGGSPPLNPRRELSPRQVKAIDVLSWTLPVVAAGSSIAGGIAALNRIDERAAWLGIAGGVASAAGVIFTGWASRIRDERLEVAHALGALGVETAGQAETVSNLWSD